LEQVIRRDAVDFYRRLKMQGGTLEEAAKLLSMPARTLRQWDYDCRPEPLHILPLGRPMARSEPPLRAAVLDLLKDQGAGVGVPKLRQAFPGMARAELADLVRGYRHELCAGKHDSARVLHWQVPGRVWALDFAAPSDAIGVLPALDGRYPYLLAVRDLASGYQLAWLPVPDATAATTQRALARLFAQHGTPLVLKADNGPAFRADETKRFLEQAGVFLLYSPPHWPGYNGAIEASIGSLKKRTARQAAQHGHVGLWTTGDVEAARLQANTSHPRRLHGVTPAQAWTQRTPPSDVERVRFELTVERQRFVARSERSIEQDDQLDHWQQGKLDRKAIERALVEHDYLLFRGRRLPLTIKAGKVTYFE
jgi:transposase InsO family protein